MFQGQQTREQRQLEVFRKLYKQDALQQGNDEILSGGEFS